jgi:tetratricopeptide (TPR) repeat protein
MSLLLQALKKAEEAKRLREAAKIGQATVATTPQNSELSLSVLEETLVEAAALEPSSSLTAQSLLLPRTASPLHFKSVAVLSLLGVLIVGGLGGYFWRHSQALSVPPSAAFVPVSMVAEASSASAPFMEAILPQPEKGVSLSVASTTVAMGTSSHAHALPRRFSGDAASVEEQSGAPTGAGIRFDTQSIEAAVPLPLAMAYRSFQQGNYRAAEEGYRRMLQLDARNRDALLGMAALAIRRGAGAEAARFYQQILSLYPRDEVAQAALYSLTPNNENSEAGLRQLSGQQADAAFALANLYAGQNRWSEAQSAYFQALSLDAGNADYAFNLAISLEHLQENKSAARYYRQALAGKGTFGRTIAEARLNALESP